jgi:hypothetical protein
MSNKVSTLRLLAQRIRLRMLTLESECATEVIHESDVAGPGCRCERVSETPDADVNVLAKRASQRRGSRQ